MKGTKEHPPVDQHPADLHNHRLKQGMEPMHLVPLIDRPEVIAIYDRSLLRMASIGAIVGATVLGGLGWLLASGSFSVAHFGQFAAAGSGAAAYATGGVGAAAGALFGSLLGLRRIASRFDS